MGQLVFKTLLLLKPFFAYLPEVQPASRNLTFWNKLMHTVVFWLIFLFCSHLSLFRIHSTEDADPFHRLRRIFASSPRTFMELGVYPIVIARYMMHLVEGSVPRPALLNAYQMLLGINTALFHALGCVKYGMYGQLGWEDSLIVMAQLIFGAITVVYLDQGFQKGYGLFSSGISLFMATNISGNIIWKAFSFTTISSNQGTEFEGAVTGLVHLLITRTDKVGALREALFRQNLPNVSNLLLTIVIILLVVYFDRYTFSIPVRSTNVRGLRDKYPLKLFYTSNMPIILQSSFVSIVYLFTQFLHWNSSSTLFKNILGNWKLHEHSGQFIPVSGLAYYVTAPASFGDMLADPIHVILYVVFTVGGCAWISKAWTEVTGCSAKHVLKRLRKHQVTMDGLRNSDMGRELNRYIVTAAVCGGMCLGVLTVLGDLMIGPFGTGAEIVLVATILCEMSETLKDEHGL